MTRHHTADEIAEAVARYVSGLTMADVAETHGVSAAAVSKWVRAAGVTRPRGSARDSGMAADDPRHGNITSYKTRGCRCEPCTAANTRYQKRYMMRHHKGDRLLVDVTGTHRRIQALVAIGWTFQEIAVACGRTTKGWPEQLLQSGVVHERTFALIDAAYERMSMTVPVGKYRTRQRSIARRNGWVPPLAWDDIDDPNEKPQGTRVKDDGAADPVVIERILAGEWRLRCNRAERLGVIARWTGSQNALERLTGWNVNRDARESVAA